MKSKKHRGDRGMREYRVIFLPVSTRLEARVREYMDLSAGEGQWGEHDLLCEMILSASFLCCEGKEPGFVDWMRRTERGRREARIDGVVVG